MDMNRLIVRVKAILLTPRQEWPVIAAEQATVAGIYRNYVCVLAAIPAVSIFIGFSLIGIGLPYVGTVRAPIGSGLSGMVVTYLMALVSVYVVSAIVDALAPTFGGQKDQLQALKVTAYASTAGWLAGIGAILPGLASLLSLVGALYGIYLLYLGLPQTMKCPPDKAAGYTAVVIVVAVIVNVLAGALVNSIAGVNDLLRTGVIVD